MTGSWPRAAGPPSVFTIATGVPFVDALAAGLRARCGDDPQALTRVRVLLPTRRACRALTDAFLKQSHGRPLLLPRLTPIGDIDEDELALTGFGDDELGANISLPPAVPALRRQLLLARLVAAMRGDDTPPDQAARLAAELARFLDQVHTEGLEFARLADLVPEEFARHWQITLEFLSVLTVEWPRVLEDEGAIDAADRRNRLLRAQAEAWRTRPPATPVIAAGSTGSIPATAELLGVVSRLPQGCVVLPGLDTSADDETWEALEPSHPQYGMARLLERLGVDRRSVAPWPAPGIAARAAERIALVNAALRPAATADGWARDGLPSPHALEGITRVDAAAPEEEARLIALLMRGTLEHPGRTAALVTLDRGLGRRVAAELARWSVEVDDSAGTLLVHTPPGAFLRLTARAVVDELAPVSLLACLKHPLAAAGLTPAAFRGRVRALERRVLRGPRPAPGLSGLEHAVAGAEPGLSDLMQRLNHALAPLADVVARERATLRDLLHAHVATGEALAATDQQPGGERLWSGEAGEAVAAFVSELDEAGDDVPALATRVYPTLLDALMAGRVVRARYGRHPRLAVWGPLEARLQCADVMILGGLNEETWPPKAVASPWMSRPMMRDFGLPLPERRIGLSAHDFVQACGAPEVWLTRSRRAEGTPTVECRWLLRLGNRIGVADAGVLTTGGRQWLAWQGLLDEPKVPVQVLPPAPTPPVSARPRRLSVTQVETWMRDPYAVYARHVLGLQALDPLDADPGAAEYGQFVHQAIDRFLQESRGDLPGDAVDALLAAGRAALGAMLDRPGIWAFWWPRFERIAGWFVDAERERRSRLDRTHSEVRGRLVLDGPAGPFELTAIADRIDVLTDGSLAIVDYKTGALPSADEVSAGFAPQLPLEAAIARSQGFEPVDRAPVSSLEYWRLRGGTPAGERKALAGDVEALVDAALDGFRNLVAAFDLADTPYRARPRPSAAPRYSDYEHLARVKEWSAGAEGDDE